MESLLLPGRPAILSSILRQRGCRDAAEAERFVSAPLNGLADPDLWPGIPEAAERIAAAVRRGKVPAVWGDYDCDGVTACAILLETFRAHGVRALWHIPDRRTEGYGLNAKGIQELRRQGAGMLVTVDCGISNPQELAGAKELGMEVVVTDHHLPTGPLPQDCTVADMHALPDGASAPCSDVCGAGLAFFLAGALNRLLEKQSGRRMNMGSLLELAALGTLADSVPLLGQNRILAKGGLARMRASARPGIAALLQVAGLIDDSLPLGGLDAGFKLAPRINAAGRLDSASKALRLLCTRDPSEARTLAEELDKLNATRKEIERAMADDAAGMGERLAASGGIALHSPDWDEGVAGICASRTADRFGVPAILFTGRGDVLKGSGRSVPGTDLHEVLMACSGLLQRFGGHAAAAGASIRKADLPAFAEAFADACRRFAKPQPAKRPDGFLSLKEAQSFEIVNALSLLEPYGEGNPQPVFRTPGPVFCTDVRTFPRKPDSGAVIIRDDTGSVRFKDWGGIAEWRAGMQLPYVDFTVGFGSWDGKRTIECSLVKGLEPEPAPDAGPALMP